jgi:PhoPQ-activated pathogenicity-related protein
LFFASAHAAAPLHTTALDDYVWKPDSHYKWEQMAADTTITGRSLDGKNHYTGYMLNMTSQQWLTPEDVTQSIWWHVLCVIVPDNVVWERNATMWVTGWSNTSPLPTNKDEDIVMSSALAMATGTVTAALFQIPNEHVTFSGDPLQKSRSEDAIIAYTWDHYLKDPTKPEWLVRLPMVKAVLRAMDATTEFISTMKPELGLQLDYYTIAGASKRGWTTWLMGAVDPTRVMAIVPIVLDAVNFVEVMHHQYKSYGGWSFALEDYYDMNITSRFDSDRMRMLQEIEDPYFYFHRLAGLPKFIINAVGDEFQQPDDNHYWWDKLPEPKHWTIIPNAEHSLATGIFEAVPAIGTWIMHQLRKIEVPKMHWKIDETTGDITLRLENFNSDAEDALRVNKYYATSCKDSPRRDFRIVNLDNPCPCGVYDPKDQMCVDFSHLWKQERLKPTHVGGNEYVAHMDAPTDGTWTAFFIDVTYKKADSSWAAVENVGTLNNKLRGPHDRPHIPAVREGHLEFTTQVSIVPNTFPYADCHEETCYGKLV